jgi:hypothetical protein
MWFEEPERAFADPVQFLAHVMVFGGVEDAKALRGIVSKDDCEVLEHAPAGVFDVRSWAYWNLVCNRQPISFADAHIAADAPNATVNRRPSAARLLWCEQH